MTARVLIVGNGFLGASLGADLAAHGYRVTLGARRRQVHAQPWIALDATDRQACARAVAAVQPDVVILAHGPSDITWCESHAREAMDGHVAAARNLCLEARAGFKVLISTDNVFPGTEDIYDESAATAPANAYGRAKRAAERVVRDMDPSALVLRASLVYGWEDPARAAWLDFFTLCALRFTQGQPVPAPVDHWNTPLLVDDLALVTRLLVARRRQGVLHVAGPDRVSRLAWARSNAAVLGCDPALVQPTARANSRYACRPANACLRSRYLGQLPELAGVSLAGVVEGARRLRAAAPSWFSPRARGFEHA